MPSLFITAHILSKELSMSHVFWDYLYATLKTTVELLSSCSFINDGHWNSFLTVLFMNILQGAYLR